MDLAYQCKRWWPIAAIIGIAGLIMRSDYAFVFVHSLVNIFAGGRSFTKIVLFLIFLLLVLLAVNFKLTLPRLGKTARQLLLGSIIAVLLLNIGSFVWYYKHYDFSLKDYIITENNGELSTTKLTHNHTLKVASGTILSWTHKANQENIDTGYAYVGLIPAWVAWATLVLLAFIFYGLVRFFLSTWKNEKYPRLYGLVFAIVTFSLIKNVVDGGPFTHEAAVSIPFIIYFLFRDKSWVKNFVLIWTAGYTALVAVCYWLGMYAGFADFSFQLYLVCLYTLILAALMHVINGKKINRAAVLGGVFILLLIYYPLSADFSIMGYRNQALDSDGALVGLMKQPTESGYNPIAVIGQLTIYSYKPSESTSVGKILDNEKLLDNFFPVSVPGQTCMAKGAYKEYQFRLSTPVVFNPVKVNGIYTKVLDAGFSKGLYRYDVELTYPPCWPRDVNIIEQYFVNSGLHTFFISQLSIKN